MQRTSPRTGRTDRTWTYARAGDRGDAWAEIESRAIEIACRPATTDTASLKLRGYDAVLRPPLADLLQERRHVGVGVAAVGVRRLERHGDLDGAQGHLAAEVPPAVEERHHGQRREQHDGEAAEEELVVGLVDGRGQDLVAVLGGRQRRRLVSVVLQRWGSAICFFMYILERSS